MHPEGIGRAHFLLRWVVIAAALAAVVVIALLFRPAQKKGIPALMEGAEALPYRSIDGRVSGGFAHRPVGDRQERSKDLRLAAAAARAQSPDTDAHVRGVAHLLMGDYDATIDALEAAARSHPDDALLLSDLSAARHARAQARDFAPDHAAALDAAERAWRLRRTPESAWNRAIAVSAFHLTDAAERAWDDYLRVDASSAWAAEAVRRRAELRFPTESEAWRPIEIRWQRRAEHDRRAIEDAVARFPAQALTYFEERLLPLWAKARLDRNTDASRDHRRFAELIAQALAKHGERFPVSALAAIDHACRNELSCDAIAHAHSRFAAGRALMESQDFHRAAAVLDETAGMFERLQSTYALAARFRRGACMLHENQFAEAVRSGKTLLAAVETRGYRTLHARILWLLGLATLHQARPEESIDSYLLARKLFIDARDTTNAASIESMLADAFDYVGDPDAAMKHRLAGLAAMRRSGDTKQMFLTLFEAGTGNVQRGFPAAADFLFAESVREAARHRRFNVAGISSMWRSSIAAQRHDFSAADEQARIAGRYWHQTTDPGQRALMSATQGQLITPWQRTARPVESLTETIRFFEDAGDRAWLPHLLRQRALLHERAGNVRAAEVDLRRAIEISEQILDDTAPAAMRDGFAGDVRANYEDMIRLLLARGSFGDALAYAERARLVSHGPNATRNLTMIPASQAAAVFEIQPDALVVWLVTRGSVELFRLPDAKDAARRVNADPAALYDLLMRDWIVRVTPGTELVILPPPALYAVPFAALLNRKSGRTVIDDYALSIASSLASLDDTPVHISASDPILIVGDPAYETLTRLPDSRREAFEVARHYVHPTLLLGDHATAASVHRHMPDASVFHFGGHATVNELEPSLSSLMLAADTRVYLHELLERRQPTKLVVLAACSTARSRSGGARGTLTLARAFLHSGARMVVGTLWPVSDAASARFAAAFHEALARGDHVPEAVRAAQLQLKSESGNDRTWAAFCVFRGNAHRGGSN